MIRRMQFLASVENTAFCTWVRNSSSLWAYPGILFMHTVGLGFVVGLSAAIDLRLLGFASDLPLRPLERAFPVIWLGFWVNAISGTILLAADATTKLTNPVFYVKMAFILLAVGVTMLMRRKLFASGALDDARVPALGKVLAVASIALWFGAITAGRLMAYIGPVSGQPGLNNALP
jgi:hypothetical protein